MGTSLKEQRRAEFKRYKEDVKAEGSRSSRTRSSTTRSCRSSSSLVIIGLAVVWYTTADGTETGHPRPVVHGRGRSRERSTSSRGPDWFFYFLFYLLRIFKWPETVVLGTVGIPTLLLILLLVAPVLRPPARAAPRPPPGRDGGGDPRRHLDGRAHLEGRHRQGGARLGADRGRRPGRVGRGAGLRGQRRRGGGRDALRAGRAA